MLGLPHVRPMGAFLILLFKSITVGDAMQDNAFCPRSFEAGPATASPGSGQFKIWKIEWRACFLQRNFLFGQLISSHLSSRLGAITVPWMQSWFSMIMSENSFVFCIITFDLLE